MEVRLKVCHLDHAPPNAEFDESDQPQNAQPTALGLRAAEEERRRAWNYKYSWGKTATAEERVAEAIRRNRYERELLLWHPLK